MGVKESLERIGRLRCPKVPKLGNSTTTLEGRVYLECILGAAAKRIIATGHSYCFPECILQLAYLQICTSLQEYLMGGDWYSQEYL